MRSIGEPDRTAHFGDEFGPQFLLLALDRGLELQEALLAERVVGRPVGLVEGASRGRDGALHVLDAGVGDLAQHLFGRGVDVVEPLPGRRLDELAVDEHADLTLHGLGTVGFGGGHGRAPFVARATVVKLPPVGEIGPGATSRFIAPFVSLSATGRAMNRAGLRRTRSDGGEMGVEHVEPRHILAPPGGFEPPHTV